MTESTRNLLSKSSWTSPVDLYIGEIMEYDMSDGGFSIIQEEKLLPPSEISRLTKLPKGFERNDAVGKLKYSKDPSIKGIGKLLEQKFREYRIWFGEANHIDESDIFSIKRDAVFLTRPAFILTKGQYITFKEKNVYDIYCLLGKDPLVTNLSERYRTYEVYYHSYSKNLAVKGISDELLPLHENGILELLRKYLKYMVRFDIKGAIKYIVDVIDKYKKFELPIDYYREFNSQSAFVMQIDGKGFLTEQSDPSMLPYMDIRYNFNCILVPLLNLASLESSR